MILFVLLSACTVAAPAPVVQQVQAQPTLAAAQPAQIQATATPAQPAAANPSTSGQKVVFKIVPEESTATYEVGEVFFNQNNRFNLAVGVTHSVKGEINADLSNPPASSLGVIEVDISQLASDSDRRDNFIRNNGLQSSKFPVARFVPNKIDALPVSYQAGQTYTFKVSGDLTIKDITKPVTFDVTASLQENVLSGTATTKVLMSDYGVGPISLAGILKTEDEVKLSLKFVAKP
jgi:polyisoprenoid-binding protein YceI